MRKEKLIEKKEDAVKDMMWYFKSIMTEDDLKAFSVPQLERICKMMERAEELRESCDPFYGLSATEVIQKSSGKIAFFEDGGTIREESKEECRTGAAASILNDYEKKIEKREKHDRIDHANFS